MWRITSLLFLLFAVASTNATLEATELGKIERKLNILAQQVMNQRLYIEEATRNQGASGIKQNRIVQDGTRPYYANSFTGKRFAAAHDHTNYKSTVGMGEVVAVLNGVEFRTRHNDYKMKMPVKAGPDTFKKTTDLIYPGIPDAVLKKGTVKEQVEEMKEWFKAWYNSDSSKRQYQKFFKPNLCYMEGFWTIPKGDKIDEPFESSRHKVDSDTWHELLQKIRFRSYSGKGGAGQNDAYLPTKIIDVAADGTPRIAQWNYRLLCHPVPQHIPLHGLRLIDDLSARTQLRLSMDEYRYSRAARFQLHPGLEKDYIQKKNYKNQYWRENRLWRSFIDLVMETVPGLDNYGANLKDDSFGYPAYQAKAKHEMKPGEQDKILNTAYYHRFYKEKKKGALGSTFRKRAFSDSGVFMAMTSNPAVAPMTVTSCTKKYDKKKRKNVKTCKDYTQRWSYAIPLEIIYTTPLQTWNPYDLAYYEKHKEEDKKGFKEVTSGGRRGNDKSPYKGTRTDIYYRTPAEFFGSTTGEADPADTTRKYIVVLDKEGVKRKVSASGIRVVLPEIAGIGRIRQRWPIAPVHGEGMPVFKEVDALKDIVMNDRGFCYMYYGDHSKGCKKPSLMTLRP